MAVGNGQWVVRYRDKASKPMTLAKAKKCAPEILKGVWQTDTVEGGGIDRLNARAAAVLDASDKWLPPVEPDLIDYIREVETGFVSHHKVAKHHRGAAQGDNYPLEYYDDGYPKLPDCLKRA
jgi:hypothetical protein